MTSFVKRAVNNLKQKNSRDQLLFLLDSLVINGAYLLTGGIFLSGYAIFLGAGDFLTALLNSGANYATILSLLSFFLFEKKTKRKHLLLTLNFLSRTLMAAIAVLPLVISDSHIRLVLLAVLVISSEVIWGIYRIGWTVWMMSTVPKETKSDYIYSRTFYTRIFMSLVSLASGFLLDLFNKSYMGFLILFIISYLFSLSDIVVLSKIEDPEYKISKKSKINMKNFFEPVHSSEYKRFLMFIFLFYLGFTMASSFTPSYMIRYLNLDYKYISIFNVLSQVVMISTNLYWVRIEKAKGYSYTICTSAFFTLCPSLIMFFVTKSTWPLLFLSNIFAGIGAGGFTSIFTYRYEIMPVDNRTIYEGWYYFALGLSVLLAPFLGQFIINSIPSFTNALIRNSQIQLLNLISFASVSVVLYFFFIRPSRKKL